MHICFKYINTASLSKVNTVFQSILIKQGNVLRLCIFSKKIFLIVSEAYHFLTDHDIITDKKVLKVCFTLAHTYVLTQTHTHIYIYTHRCIYI